jgi:epoxyqueuosine reductase
LTIELRGAIPVQHRTDLGNWVFGCDICQEVCPWNRKAPVSQVTEYQSRTAGGVVDLVWWAESREEDLERVISGTALRRTGVRGLRRNVAVALGNSGVRAALPSLAQLAQDSDPVVRECATWAIEQLGEVDARSSPAAAGE